MNDDNGNGNGHEKAFVLAQPKTPEQLEREKAAKRMPELRRRCSRDPRLRNCVGAKWLFGTLTDNSFLACFGGNGRGEIFCSLSDLSFVYGHSREALAVWRDKLIETRWIRVTEMWPKARWEISEVCRQPELFPPNSEFTEVLAKSAREPAPQPDRQAENANFLETSESRRQVLPVVTTGVASPDDRCCQSRRQVLPVPTTGVASPDDRSCRHDRQDLPALTTGVAGFDSESPPPPLTRPATADSDTEESPDVKPSGSDESFERSTLNAQERTLKARTVKAENLFLLEVEAMMERWQKGSSKAELQTSGGWWRVAFRADAGLMRRVLADTLCAVKEGQVRETPGQMAVDTWKRWGGKLPEPVTA